MININSEEIKDKGSNNEQRKKYFYPGKIINYKIKENEVILELRNKKIILELLDADIVRVVMNKKEELNLKSTYGIIDHNLKYNNFKLLDKDDKLIIKTSSIKIIVNKTVFSLSFYDKNGELIHKDAVPALSWSKNKIKVIKKTSDKEYFYGLGEKTGFLDKKGKKYTMWNTDVFEAHIESTDPLYISIPFYIAFSKKRSYGIYFDNSYKSHFDFRVDENGEYSFWAEGGKIDYYFINGPDVKEVINKYTKLTGKMPLPPKWSLGYHQSRYSYKTEDEVRKLAHNFRNKDIPCDVIHLDIHYMDGYRVFTWDENRFSQPNKLLDDLSEEGLNIVNIIDPGVKKDPAYDIYKDGIKEDYFCRYLDGRLFSGDVWPEESVFPDFTQNEVRKWWGDLHKSLLDDGVRGIWNDMNEPAVFNETFTMDVNVMHENDGDSGLHKRFHNQYALLEAMGTYNGIKEHTGERPFVLTRAGFSGIQRYAASWTGDNRSIWDHLKLAIPMLLNMGLSGISFAGTDIGGFTDDSNGELLTRWTQLGTFMPFFRNHSSLNTTNQEPWAFGEKYERIIKKFIQLRYKFMPYIYNLFYETSQTGLPIIRPLFLEYPEDEKTYNMFNELMVGEDILTAPVYEPAKEKKLVYLPEGKWVNYFSNKKYNGNQYIIENTPLETMPLYIKKGAILVLGEAMNYINENKKEKLKIVIYLDDNINKNSYTLYEDDGISYAYKNGNYNLTKFSYLKTEKSLEININNIYKNYDKDYNQYEIILKDYDRKFTNISYNNSKITKWEYIQENNKLIFNVDIKEGKIVIN